MARPKRFELLTPRFVVWCSIQLRNGPYITALACRSFDPAANVRCYLAIDGSKSKLPEPKTFAAKKHVHIHQTRPQPGYAMSDAAVECMSPESVLGFGIPTCIKSRNLKRGRRILSGATS
jgi:hypothetical protein